MRVDIRWRIIMPCTFELENELRAAGSRWIAGVDEVGRGSLAGPVFAAAVILPEGFFHPTLDDSKQLLPVQREEIYAELRADGRILIAFASASVTEIDRINILRASHLAMKRALRGLPCKPDCVLVDGLPIRRFGYKHRAVVDGDTLSFSIAAASVVAKVERDRLMVRLARRHRRYGFDNHKGYSTREHIEALHRHGPCRHHRRTFEPVAASVFSFKFPTIAESIDSDVPAALAPESTLSNPLPLPANIARSRDTAYGAVETPRPT
jgi:ribonuclease HII